MKRGFFADKAARLTAAFSKARDYLRQKLTLISKGKLDDDAIEKLEDLLIEADFGRPLSLKIIQALKALLKQRALNDPLDLLKEAILQVVKKQSSLPQKKFKAPWIVMVIGVNGNGKTTSCAKLAAHHRALGRKPLLIAADTYRAAGIEQLQMWAERLDISIEKGQRGQNASAVVFEGMQTVGKENYDVCIIDSAGRLHNQSNLMLELQKMQRVCGKIIFESPQEILLVVEAPTGQNAIAQVQQFKAIVPLTGIVLTKIDGSAKGGIALAIQEECQIPVRYLGTGEEFGDLETFELDTFVNALF